MCTIKYSVGIVYLAEIEIFYKEENFIYIYIYICMYVCMYIEVAFVLKFKVSLFYDSVYFCYYL